MQQQADAPTRRVIVNGVDRNEDIVPGPSVLYEALRNQREVLDDQLEALEGQRRELNREIEQGRVQGASKVGVESRIMNIDRRIADLEKQITGVDGQLATQAAVPGAIVEHVETSNRNSGPPEEAFILGTVFMLAVMMPISIAYARRIWRRGAATVSEFPAELSARLSRIEQAIDTSAVEIERIGEGQRFVTKLFSEARVPVLPPNNDRVS